MRRGLRRLATADSGVRGACGSYRDRRGARGIRGDEFCGFDFEPPGSEPMPWWTLVWGGPLHQRTWNYATFDEAKVGHWKVVDLAREAMKQHPAT